MTLSTYLTFDGNCREVFEFYRSVFGGDFEVIQTFGDGPDEMPVPGDERDRVMHVSYPIGSSVLMGSDSLSSSPEATQIGNNFSISHLSTSREETDELFAKMSEGGVVTMPLRGDVLGRVLRRLHGQVRHQLAVQLRAAAGAIRLSCPPGASGFRTVGVSAPEEGSVDRGEIPAGTLASMLRDLHIDRRELQVVRYAYPCSILRDEEEARASGREAYTVTFPDVYGANTGGWSRDEAVEMARDCLGVALGMYVKAREEIPAPSPLAEGQVLISVAPIVAAKLALHTAMREQGVTNVALAARLGLHENAVRRLLDPGHRSHSRRSRRPWKPSGARW